MLSRHFWITLFMFTATLVAAEPLVLPLPNPGFENQAQGWSIPDDGLGAISDEQAASGKFSLKITDRATDKCSNIVSERVPVTQTGAFELRGKVYAISGDGLGMYVRAYDKDGTCLNSQDSHLMGLGGTDRKWRSFSSRFYPPAETATIDVCVHSYIAARVEAYLDDLQLVFLGADALKPPWEGTYKLRPDQKDRLTAADVVGPDGIVYPNWTRCGVQGGIPQVKPFRRVEDFGAKAGDDNDDSVALQAACNAAGKAGGGAVLLGEGTYQLDMPISVTQNGVVIRGAGRDRTKLIFRYGLPKSGVCFYGLQPGAKIGKNTRLEMQARPTGLMAMTMSLDGTMIGEWARSTHSGNTFSFAKTGRDAIGKVADGPHTLKGVATYEDGSKLTGELPVTLDSTDTTPWTVPSSRAAINFEGGWYTGPRIKLTADGQRGATSLQLESTQGLAVGDCIVIEGPATERWKTLTRNACLWGTYRRYMVTISAINGNTITLEQPLRIEFPIIDGSWVQKALPLQRCGIEDLSLEQTENLWIDSAIFNVAMNCWARNVNIRMCGRFPVYGSSAKFCEIRDCVFDDAWFKGGGGTAYTGWEVSYDCLMDGIETFKYRHAPLFQWSASGCVIRNGVFHESDAQWHSGWTNENLFENCVIESIRGNGGYGYGMWASPPEDSAHGPNGPRNVIYNCDVKSELAGLWMGGMNENWLVLYNRFQVGTGPGVFAKTASFDHIIRGNVFILQDNKAPMVQLPTPDCIGIELIGNKVYGGSAKSVVGTSKPAVDQGNQFSPLGEAPRPAPAVPSIYDWQKNNVKAR
jgi:hypothetical protein